MSELAIRLLLLVLATLQMLPLMAWRGAAALRRLYAVEVEQPDLLILLRHRALLLALPGVLLLWSMPVPTLRVPALALAALSMASFVLLIASTECSNQALRRIAMIDVVGLLLMAATAAITWRASGSRGI